MPLLWGSLAFLLGIWLASLAKLSAAAWAGLGGGALLFAGLLWLAKKPGWLVGWARIFPSPFEAVPGQRGVGVRSRDVSAFFLLAAVLCLGAARYQRAQPTFTPADLAWYNDQDNPWEVDGVVVQPPEPRQGYTRLRVQVEQVRQEGETLFQSIQGRLLVNVPPGDWRYGDRVRLDNTLETPWSSELFDYRGRLAHQGIYSQMSSALAHLLSREQGSLLLAGLYHLRTRASLLLYRLFPGPEAALLAGILLGDESGIASDTQQAFRETGTAHLIAISGFNISIIGGLFVVLFRCYSAASGGWSRPGWASPPNTDCSRQQGFGAFSSIFHASGFFRFDGESTPTLLPLTPTVDWHMDSGVLYFPIPLNGVERQCWVSALHHGAHRIDHSSVVIHFAARHDGHGALDPAPYAFRILLQG